MSTKDKEKLKRHRSRNASFDLNRSSPQIKEKYAKDNNARRMPPPVSPNIIDMSSTINATNIGAGAMPKNRRNVDSDQRARKVSFEEVWGRGNGNR